MWLFIPSFAVMTVVLVYPLASAIYYSFLRYYLAVHPAVHRIRQLCRPARR